MKKDHRGMNKAYWDGMAACYEDEIMSVFHDDRNGLIKKKIRQAALKNRTIADIGCGVGHFLEFLSRNFSKVYANDISMPLLSRARSLCGHRDNIVFLPGDITAAFRRLPQVDCALSVNSIISASMGMRNRMFKAITAVLKPGGLLILVVPSLESSLLVNMRFFNWKCRDGVPCARAISSVYPSKPEEDNKARQGLIDIDGVSTKHFLKEELELILSGYGFDILGTEKIEYGWNTEFDHPPAWMEAPYPWDWLITAKKIHRRKR